MLFFDLKSNSLKVKSTYAMCDISFPVANCFGEIKLLLESNLPGMSDQLHRNIFALIENLEQDAHLPS